MNEIRTKVESFYTTAQRLDSVARLESDIGKELFIKILLELTRQSQDRLVALYKELEDAEAQMLECQHIAVQEMAAGEDFYQG
jgi:tryptophanyl-tRNA synthetase